MKALQRTSKLLLLILCGIAMLYPVSGLAVSCKHEETFTQSSYFCHSIDDNFHEFYDYVVIRCRNFECLEIISSETKNYTREKHQFQNNGKCKVCDYQRASGHKCQFGSGLSSGLIEVSSEVVRRDSTYCYYKRYQVIKCLVCGHIMEEIFEDNVRYGHSFSAGKCSRCGFEKEAFCLHSNKTSYYDSTIPPIFSNITPTHHNVRNGYKMICDDCGANTGETGHFETITEAHSLNNGKCVCGYTQSSTPTVTSRPTTPSGDHNCAYSSNTKKTYYKHNETQHWQYTEVKCYICGNDMYVRNPEGEREEHRFENGTCKVCGYQGECYLTVDQGHISGLMAHVTGGQGATINVSSNVAWTVTEDLNWVTVHNITGNGNGSFTVYVDANTGYAREGVITVYGSPCESISIRITQEGAVVDPATCEHDYGYDYDQAKDGVWEKVDANTHKRTKLLYTYVCTICGHSYEAYGPDDANVVEGHDWGKTSWTRWLTNETEHCHKGKQTCTAPGCGATKNVSETEEHSFVDGKCVCGYSQSSSTKEKTCQHEMIKQGEPERIVTQYDSDDWMHVEFHRVVIISYEVCKKCGYQEKTEEQELPMPKSHEFEGASCKQCGYSKTEDYFALLASMPEGANPMENEMVVDILYGELSASGMSRDKIEEIFEMVERAPATYRDLYLYSFYAYEKDANAPKNQFTPFKEDSSGIYVLNGVTYGVSNTVSITKDASITTQFHEFGHAIEANLSYNDDVKKWNDNRYYASLDCFEAMKDDVRTFITRQATSQDHPFLSAKWNDLTENQQEQIIRSIIGSDSGDPVAFVQDEWEIDDVSLDSKLQSIRDELVGNMIVAAYGGTNDTRSAYMVTDCMEGMTNGAVSINISSEDIDAADAFWGLGKYYSGGHMKDRPNYWFTDNGVPIMNQCYEAWAEYYSAVMTGNQDAINSNLYYFPETCAYFDTLAAEMLNHYKEQAGVN